MTSQKTALIGNSSNTGVKHRRPVTVEIVVLLYAACFGFLQVLLSPQYIENRVAQMNNFTLRKNSGSNESCTDQIFDSTPDMLIELDIASQTSNWVMLNTALAYLPAVAVSPLYGALGDNLGRKIHILIPCIGELLYIAFILIVFHFNLPLSAYVCASLFSGFGGGYKCLMTGCYAYISDVTSNEKTRLFRIAIVQSVLLGTMSIVQLLGGYSIQYFGYIPAAWICLGLSCITILYIVVPGCLPESNKQYLSQATRKKINLTYLLKEVYYLFTNDNIKRNKILLLLLMYFIADVIQLSQAAAQAFLIYGLGPPFCWSSITLGYFSFAFLISGALGMSIGTRILSKLLSATSILHIAYGFGLLTSITATLAPSTAIFTIGAVVGGPRSMDEPVFNNLLSTVVLPDEKGVAFAVEASVQSLANFLSPLILNPIYSATVESYPSAVFLVMAVGFGVLYILTWVWMCYDRKPKTRDEDFVSNSI